MQGIIDTNILDVEPAGATPAYASPEQLRSLQIQLEQRQHADLLVNGAASDMFSAGVVLYEQLTGQLPFLPAKHVKKCPPDSVPNESRKGWQQYEMMSQAHHAWVNMQHGLSTSLVCVIASGLWHEPGAVSCRPPLLAVARLTCTTVHLKYIKLATRLHACSSCSGMMGMTAERTL